LLKRAARRLHGAVDILSPSGGQGAQSLPVDGRDHRHRLPRSRSCPLPVDQPSLIRDGLVTLCVNVFLFHAAQSFVYADRTHHKQIPLSKLRILGLRFTQTSEKSGAPAS
jgi:hypothetical protein